MAFIVSGGAAELRTTAAKDRTAAPEGRPREVAEPGTWGYFVIVNLTVAASSLPR